MAIRAPATPSLYEEWAVELGDRLEHLSPALYRVVELGISPHGLIHHSSRDVKAALKRAIETEWYVNAYGPRSDAHWALGPLGVVDGVLRCEPWEQPEAVIADAKERLRELHASLSEQ